MPVGAPPCVGRGGGGATEACAGGGGGGGKADPGAPPLAEATILMRLAAGSDECVVAPGAPAGADGGGNAADGLLACSRMIRFASSSRRFEFFSLSNISCSYEDEIHS